MKFNFSPKSLQPKTLKITLAYKLLHSGQQHQVEAQGESRLAQREEQREEPRNHLLRETTATFGEDF